MRRRSHTIKRSRGERGFFALAAAVVFVWLVQIAIFVAGIWIAAHFIRKYW